MLEKFNHSNFSNGPFEPVDPVTEYGEPTELNVAFNNVSFPPTSGA